MADHDKSSGMSMIVKTVTGWLKGFILVFGAYLVLYGHHTPGGGFSGGVVIACGFILLMLAYGRQYTLGIVSQGAIEDLVSAGALIFLAVAIIGMLVTGVFFTNFISTPESAHFTLLSAGMIPISEIGIGLLVGMALFLVFVVLSVVHIKVGGDGHEMHKRGEGEQ